MSEPEDVAQTEGEELLKNSDDVQEDSKSDELERQVTPSPTDNDTAGKNEDTQLVLLADDNSRSALTTPEVQESTHGVDEDSSGENSNERLAEDDLETGREKENGAAGSTPWPRDKPDDGDVPPQEDREDLPDEDFQNKTPTPQPIDNEANDQITFAPETENKAEPNEVQIFDVAPTFETNRGAHYATGTFSRKPLPLTINKAAIESSARNKLPLAEIKGRVVHLARHTEASSQKTKKWYKGDNYVDKDSYSWRNMQLFDDFQRHLYTPEGAVRTSFKK
ncbi:uncharacterized protein LOC106071705 [Biomphalaria glabrata]|uniref:Uncharacterized protein LOC106071705 n=1 Tax=Biomphalaria glabrata TaxID=6526 RepID=A0A9U8EI01_BIOGL|nr:uncharacterized protein LOC106071705 [Biomphalaria glabrata]XP_013087331.2 uncharacterized protein LOC106071705 [Biomphalaria glabrata]